MYGWNSEFSQKPVPGLFKCTVLKIKYVFDYKWLECHPLHLSKCPHTKICPSLYTGLEKKPPLSEEIAGKCCPSENYVNLWPFVNHTVFMIFCLKLVPSYQFQCKLSIPAWFFCGYSVFLEKICFIHWKKSVPDFNVQGITDV